MTEKSTGLFKRGKASSVETARLSYILGLETVLEYERSYCFADGTYRLRRKASCYIFLHNAVVRVHWENPVLSVD